METLGCPDREPSLLLETDCSVSRADPWPCDYLESRLLPSDNALYPPRQRLGKDYSAQVEVEF